MTAPSHRNRRLPGPEWLFLLAILPLLGPGRPTTLTHSILFGGLFLLVLGVVLLRRRLGPGRLALVASLALIPVLALAISMAGHGWSSVLLITWTVGFGWYLFHNRPVSFPGTGPVVWLVLVSVTWALVFLLVADLFLGGLTASVGSSSGRILAVIQVLSLFSAVVLGLLVWWQRRGTPGAVSVVSLLLLGTVVLLEAGDMWRLARSTAEIRELISRNDYETAAQKIDALIDLGERKGPAFVYPELLILSARIDLARGDVSAAARGLIRAADMDAESREETLAILAPGLLGRLLLCRRAGADDGPLMTDLEYSGQDFLLLDRWGRVVKITRSPPAINMLSATPLPFGSVAVDLEVVEGGEGMLVLDSAGNIAVIGEPRLKPIVQSMSHPLRDAVDLEIAPGGEGFYVINAYGEIAAFGKTRFSPRDNPHEWRFPIVRDLEIWPAETGLLLLDGNGGVHPVGTIPLDLHSPDAAYWSGDVARDLEVDPGGTSISLVSVDAEWGVIGNGSPAPRGLPFPTLRPECYEIAPDGRELAVMASDGSIQVFSPGSRESRNLAVTCGFAAARRNAGGEAARSPREDVLGYFGAEFLESAAESPLPAESPPDLVVRALPGDTSGSLLVLDRIGRIWNWREGKYEALIDAPAAPEGVEAVAFRRHGDAFLILLNSGKIVETGQDGPEGAGGTGGVPVPPPDPVDLITRDGGTLTLDAFGGVRTSDLPPGALPAVPEVSWGFPIARRLNAIGNTVYVLDGLGAIHAPGETKGPLNLGSAYFSVDLVRDFEPDEDGSGFYVMDCAGRLTRTEGASPLPPDDAVPPDLRKLRKAFAELEADVPAGESLDPAQYTPFDHAVDLVFNPRDRTFFILFRTGKVSVIHGGS